MYEKEGHSSSKDERFQKLGSECLCFYGICYMVVFYILFELLNYYEFP